MESIGARLLQLHFGPPNDGPPAKREKKLVSPPGGNVFQYINSSVRSAIQYYASILYNHLIHSPEETDDIVEILQNSPSPFGKVLLTILNIRDFSEDVQRVSTKSDDTVYAGNEKLILFSRVLRESLPPLKKIMNMNIKFLSEVKMGPKKYPVKHTITDTYGLLVRSSATNGHDIQYQNFYDELRKLFAVRNYEAGVYNPFLLRESRITVINEAFFDKLPKYYTLVCLHKIMGVDYQISSYKDSFVMLYKVADMIPLETIISTTSGLIGGYYFVSCTVIMFTLCKKVRNCQHCSITRVNDFIYVFINNEQIDITASCVKYREDAIIIDLFELREIVADRYKTIDANWAIVVNSITYTSNSYPWMNGLPQYKERTLDREASLKRYVNSPMRNLYKEREPLEFQQALDELKK